MADRYYVNSPLVPGPVYLTGPEAYHLAAVCRARPGDAVCLFNGDGAEYPAIVQSAGKREVTLEVIRRETPARERGGRLVIAAPLPKSDRADFLIEKLTELGVAEFVPLSTARSVVHPRATKLDRLQRAVIEASKQCGRNVLMRVHSLASWTDFAARSDLTSQRFVAHPGAVPVSHVQGDAVFAVGPEGGFTDEEIALAMELNWKSVDLGPRILRVETAAIALAALSSV
jgi:16S rRNA (uracil1498-N3)-methyltransferase